LLKKPYRIIKNKEYKDILNSGRFLRNRFFLLKFKPNNLKNSRFGIVVSTKVSKKAVDRNLVKRRVREIIRANLENIKDGFDVVLVMKKESLGLNYSEIEHNIVNSLCEANLL